MDNDILIIRTFIGIFGLCLHTDIGLEIKIFSREPNCIFKSHLQVLCIETSTFLGSLQKFEGAAGEFKGALGCWHSLISSPETYANYDNNHNLL